MTKSEEARRGRPRDQAVPLQLIERFRCRVVAERGHGLRDVDVPGVADDRTRFEESSGVSVEVVDPRPDGGRDLPGNGVGIPGTCKLLQEQRIASRSGEGVLPVDVPGELGEHRLGRFPLERIEVERYVFERAPRSAGGQDLLGCRARPEAQRDQQRDRGRAPEQMREELSGRRVRPVDVVDLEEQRPFISDQRQEIGERPIEAPAFGRRSGSIALRLDCREAPGEQSELAGPERFEGVSVRKPLGECVDDRDERCFPLELAGPPREHDEAMCRRPLAELAQQPGLADPGLAANREQTHSATGDGVERAVDCLQLVVAPVKNLPGHAATLAGRVATRSARSRARARRFRSPVRP